MPAQKEVVIEIPRIERGEITLNLLGETGVIFNRMAAKAKRELLRPRRKTAADRAANQKHDVLVEYHDSATVLRDDLTGPLLGIPTTALKGALSTAALDLPGTSKTQVGRLVYVLGDYLPIYGLPQLRMTVVRMADISKTPDIRSVAIIVKWATTATIRFTRPFLTEQAVTNLAYAAGQNVGIGDGRPEKGKLNFGTFGLVNDDDPEFLALKAITRSQQREAFDQAVPYNEESREMWSIWQEGIKG